ncbi:hypothetical protein E5288_WYG005275 [Bos mutus]|uniref:Lymphocyte antigen 6 complex locus protein G5c n=1 Tax=Bos mutus TaxID=72004 RepID=A0A6B0S6F5_9CETA|nr:hypothetical protein [Bos mutus]
MSLVFGQSEIYDQEPIRQKYFNEYLSCYRCLFETKELGCLLGSDTCLVPKGSSCITLLIKNNSGFETMRTGHRNPSAKCCIDFPHSRPWMPGPWKERRCLSSR